MRPPPRPRSRRPRPLSSLYPPSLPTHCFHTARAARESGAAATRASNEARAAARGSLGATPPSAAGGAAEGRGAAASATASRPASRPPFVGAAFSFSVSHAGADDVAIRGGRERGWGDGMGWGEGYLRGRRENPRGE